MKSFRLSNRKCKLTFLDPMQTSCDVLERMKNVQLKIQEANSSLKKFLDIILKLTVSRKNISFLIQFRPAEFLAKVSKQIENW